MSFQSFLFQPARFSSFSSTFNLPEEKVGGGGGGEEKRRSLPRIKFVPASAESAVESTTGSPGVTAGTSDPRFCRELEPAHTPHLLAGSSCSRLEFLPVSSLIFARCSPRLRRAACQRAVPLRFARPGVGDAGLSRVRGCGCVPAIRRRRAAWSSSPARRQAAAPSPPPLLLPRLAGAEKLPTCVASPPFPSPPPSSRQLPR